MLLIGLSMLASGLILAQIFKNSHIEALELNMGREIKLLETTFDFRIVDGTPQVTEYYTSKAKELEKLIDSRVTFIGLNGVVIGDSEMDAGHMDNHLNRQEIVSAKNGKIGSAIRFSDTIGEDMLYVADYVKSSNGFEGYIRLSMSLSNVSEGLNKGWLLMIGGLMVLFITATIVSYRIASSLTKPLEHITKVANDISRLDYDARVKLTRTDEIGQLGLAINGMADSLQQQLKRIRENEHLLQSVLANMTGGILMIDPQKRVVLINAEAQHILKMKEHQLLGKPYQAIKRNYEFTKFIETGLESKERLQEERHVYDPEDRILHFDGVPMYEGNEDEGNESNTSNDSNADGRVFKGMLFLLQDVTDIRRLEVMRSEFVANVSHELKTPIAAVKGFAETLLTGGVQDEETARSFLKIIYDEGDRLNRLIGDILDLSKIESRRVLLEYEPVHVKDLFDRIFEVLHSSASKKSISMQHSIADYIFIEGDEDRLRQIFMNLLSNAISYTPEGGRVRVEARIAHENEENERIIITVSDTGIGIPKKDLPRIFERFYRVDKARSRSSGGTGLGLSIVKHLIELHHGTITVESKVGEGSSFILDLPVMHNLD
jgi:two-component system phosphate regulon sensor histidine kinase PhoR